MGLFYNIPNPAVFLDKIEINNRQNIFTLEKL